jgi:ubiquitin C-terminal hydrolase
LQLVGNGGQPNAQVWQTIGVPLAGVTGPNTLDHFVQQVFDGTLDKPCINAACDSRRDKPQDVLHKQVHRIANRPKVLVVHLMRFKLNSAGRPEKVRTKVTAQEILDLSNVYDGNGRALRYRLKSVIHHRGGLNSGHYICMTRNKNDTEYFEINDLEVCLT